MNRLVTVYRSLFAASDILPKAIDLIAGDTASAGRHERRPRWLGAIVYNPEGIAHHERDAKETEGGRVCHKRS